MSIQSARSHLEQFGNGRSYCVPMTLDAIMPKADLPDKYYELFGAANRAGETTMSSLVKALLKDFFNVTPGMATETTAVSMYHSFDASVQPYCPDPPYEYDLDILQGSGITHKHLRLEQLFKTAADNGCNILFNSVSSEGHHVAGLELVDTSPLTYLIRNTKDRLRPANNRLYTSHELWLPQELNPRNDEYAPIPEFARSYYPDSKTSWELYIFPSEPFEPKKTY